MVWDEKLATPDYFILSTALELKRHFRTLWKNNNINIDYYEWRAINYIGENPKCHQLAVANFLDKDKPFVTRLIEGLIKKKMVNRKADNIDKRVQRLELSSSGARTLAQSREVFEAFLEKALYKFSRYDKRELIRLCRQVEQNLQPEEA